MALRITQSKLLSSTALEGSLRLSSHYLMTAIPLGSAKRITQHQLATTVGLHLQTRVTGHYIQSVISIHTYFELIRLESTSELHDFLGEGAGGNPDNHGDITYELAAGPIPEHNPYRPRIPEQLIAIGADFYDFYEENQNIHRQQHNITQMGDTTFPFQLFIQTHTDKQFTLGAVGRFFHEDFGIIHCRYVQFDEMVPVGFAQCPVGLFDNASLLEWRVTNDLSKSHPDLVIGIATPYAISPNDTYGWVIVDGPNLQEVKNDSTDAAIGESFAWAATGSVSNSAIGKVIGRRVNRVHEATSLLPGQLWIRTESFSEQELRNLIDDQTASLQAAIDALQAAVGQLPGADELSNLSAELIVLRNKFNLEVAARKAADLAIQQQISALNFATVDQLNNAITNAQSALTAAVSNLTAQIDSARAIAIEALNKANSIPDWSFLQDQISSILAMLAEEITRPKGKFPVVDGSIPPNLVYTDDGNLVYTETF